ncbi:hypothetical protein [Neptunomonas sp.]|uniref:hypothetical protein n=1 Tax=Neptunomonas sp. TaxID=1971898 RepID=UPI0025D1BE7D|nr:hypothetical protein [Neptunomonas sp.]
MKTNDIPSNILTPLIIGMFDAAAPASIILRFADTPRYQISLANLANDLASTYEFQSIYAESLSNKDFSIQFATRLLNNNVDETFLQEGIQFIESTLSKGASRGEAALDAITTLLGIGQNAPNWGVVVQNLHNKIEVSTHFIRAKPNNTFDFSYSQQLLETITSEHSTVDAVVSSLYTQHLTPTQDTLIGSAADDIFIASLINNKNTAQTGDTINADEGNDSLKIQLGSSISPLELETSALENVYLTTKSTDAQQVNAEKMLGTNAFWSVESQGDIAIDNINALSGETSIGFRNSAAGDTSISAYFDEAKLSQQTNQKLLLEIFDLASAAQGETPLFNNPYSGVALSLNGEPVNIGLPDASPIQTTPEDFVVYLNQAISHLGLSSFKASLGASYSQFYSDGQRYSSKQIVLNYSGTEKLEALGYYTDYLTGSNLHTAIYKETNELIGTQAIFDYVGKGEKSGNFIAGVNTNNSSAGIQEFTINVDHDSWLSSVSSTNNALEKVEFHSIGNNGTLQIDELTDVRLFDALGMKNDITLSAVITDQAVTKYAIPEQNPTPLTYLTAAGDDNLLFNLAKSVAQADLTLFIETGKGNDRVEISGSVTKTINTEAGDDTISTDTLNQAASSSTINTGKGSDTLILSTQQQSHETIVFTGTNNGSLSITNFDASTEQGIDYIDLSAYIGHITGSSLNTLNLGNSNYQTNHFVHTDNNITIITGFSASAGQSLAQLSSEALLAAITVSNISGENNFGNVGVSTLTPILKTGEVYATQNHIVMFKDQENQGEYTLFHLASDYHGRDFEQAALIGTIDFGENIELSAASFV